MKRVLLSFMAIAAGATIAMAQELPVFPDSFDVATESGNIKIWQGSLEDIAKSEVGIDENAIEFAGQFQAENAIVLSGSTDKEVVSLNFSLPEGWSGVAPVKLNMQPMGPDDEDPYDELKTRANDFEPAPLEEFIGSLSYMGWFDTTAVAFGNPLEFPVTAEPQYYIAFLYLHDDGTLAGDPEFAGDYVDAANSFLIVVNVEKGGEVVEAPEFPDHLDYTLNGEKELPGIDVKQGFAGSSFIFSVKGECDSNFITVTFETPEGWDGLMIADAFEEGEISTVKTRGAELIPVANILGQGFVEGNSITYVTDGEAQWGQIALIKGDMACSTFIDFDLTVSKTGGSDVPGDEDPVFPESLIVDTFPDEGLEVDQHNEDGQIFIAIYGEVKQDTFDVVLDVPEGWDGFISMPYSEDVTIGDFNVGPRMAKAPAPEPEWVPIVDVLDDGIFMGNKFTFKANGTRQQVEVHLYRGEDVDVANFITLTANVTKFVVNPELVAANQAAYDNVIDQIDAVQAEYDATLEELKEKYPYFDFLEWEEMIGNALEQERSGAEQALYGANEDGKEFLFPFSDEEIKAMIAEMTKDAENAPIFPDALEVTLSDNDGVKVSQGAIQGVYTISVSGMSEQKELTLTMAVPEGWDGFIGICDVDGGNSQAAPSRVVPAEWVSVKEMLAYGLKEGNTMTFPVDGVEHNGQYYLYKGDVLDIANPIVIEFNVESPLTAANTAAYDEVIAKIDALRNEYEAALAAVTEKYPDYDFSEWEEIISNALAEAASGAEQALKAANNDGVEFNFAFDGEDIKGMIAEMEANPALIYANQAAYDAVIAKVDELRKEYEEAVAEIKETNPDFDFTEWEEIGTLLEDMKGWAAQALASANEEGEEFNFAFDGEDIENMIEMMKVAAEGSGVAGVAVDDNASYYDLNGHKINRPQAGMYIKVVDGKSSKVVIK